MLPSNVPSPALHHRRPHLWSWVVCGVLALSVGAPAAMAQSFDDDEDDEAIVIEGEPAPAPLKGDAGTGDGDDELIIVDDDDDDDMLVISDDDDDELIIVENDGDADTSEGDRVVDGALGRLWEAFHLAVNWRAQLSAQTTSLADAPFRSRGEIDVETWLLPAPNLSVYANGFARGAVDTNAADVALVPVVDLYEFYAKVNIGIGSVQLGRLVVPWGRTQVAALGDRLQPRDLRRGRHFPGPAWGRQPQWGATLRSSLGNLSVEGVVFVLHEPTEGSISAANQGGLSTGRYQQALLRRPYVDDSGKTSQDRASLIEPLAPQEGLTLGLRVWRRVGDFDFGASAVWGVDDTVGINASPAAQQWLAAQLLDDARLPNVDPASCVGEQCLAPGALQLQRTASLVLHAEWGLGLVILKSALLAQPRISGLIPALAPGKTVLLYDDDGVRSTKLSQYGGVIAAEAGLGDWVTGSVEVFDIVYGDVPRGARLLGVDLLDADASQTRWVHRLALGASLTGKVIEDVSWRLHGEMGVLQPDISGVAEVRYQLPILKLYIAAQGNLFVGLPGAPGWMRQPSTGLALVLGQGL